MFVRLGVTLGRTFVVTPGPKLASYTFTAIRTQLSDKTGSVPGRGIQLPADVPRRNHREAAGTNADIAVHWTVAKFRRPTAAALLTASIALVCIVMAGELDGPGSVASDRPSVSATPVSDSSAAPSTSLAVPSKRPPFLPEPDPNAETLRSYASRIGLYFGSMMDSLKGNGWETALVRNTLSSEFNLMVPGNQLKWWVIHPT